MKPAARNFVRANQRYITLLAMIVILFAFFSVFNSFFFNLESIMNIVRRVTILGIVSIGMTIVLLSGGLDLSVGSNLALAGAISALVLNGTNSALAGIVTAIACASALGMINGLMVGVIKVNSVILTLATMGIARSLTLVISQAVTIRISNGVFKWLGQSSIAASGAYIPYSGMLVVVLFILFSIILRRTVFGKKIYALGSNINAAKLAGIRVERNVVSIYVITGLLVGIATIVSVGKSSSAVPWAGLGLEFEAITVVILGGTFRAGEGDLVGTFLGVLLVGVLFGGLGLYDISPYIQEIIKGLLLLTAVIIYHYNSKRTA
jgi:ribose/xylose/arabinose/galactoside ABC-type transport system permease subunit